MNSYTFDLTGNIYLLIFLTVAALLLSIYTYTRTNPPISKNIKYFLIFLRTLTLSLLLLVIFQPILTKITGTEKSPKVAVLFDNSGSMIADDAGGNRDSIITLIKNKLLSDKFNDENTEFAFYDNSINFKSVKYIDSMNFSGDYTNISKAIRKVSSISEDENIRSILLITDGAFNSGDNPIYDAEKFGHPIDIIGVGDTNKPKDIKITSLLTNEITFKNSVVPVNVNIESIGFERDSIDISLFENSKLLENKKILISKNQQKYSSFFKYKPEITGNIKLTASVKVKDNEISSKNNHMSRYIEVKDNKRVISIFSGYPYSDISFLKQVISQNNSFEIREFIQKNNAGFYDTHQDKDYQETDLFVFIGFPIFSTSPEIINKISKQLERGKSVLFIAGAETDYSKLRLLEKYLPFNTASVQKREYSARALFSTENLSDPLLKFDGKLLDINILNDLPPVFRTELFVAPKPESDILAKVIVNNVELNEPFLIKRNFQNKRSVAILAYGLFKWKLDNKSDIDFYSSFVNNTINWLIVNDVDKLVDFKTTKNFYSGNEEIEISAQVYDDALNPVSNADVTLILEDSSGVKRDIQLTSIGNGRYFTQIEELPSGEYSYTGKAEFDKKLLGKDNGKFSVGKINIEYQNLTMNYNLLKNISKTTNGKFYFPDELNNINELFNRDDFKPYPITVKNDYTIWSFPFILIFVIILFALEWIIRKRKGLI